MGYIVVEYSVCKYIISLEIYTYLLKNMYNHRVRFI